MEQFFAQWGPASSAFWVRGLWALALFIVILWLAQVAHRGTQRSLQRASASLNAVIIFSRITQLIIVALGGVLALAVLGVELPALAALVGFSSVILTLMLQDILRSFVAGWYLLIERPFQVGDTVQVDGQQGVVEDVGTRTTILRGANGDRAIVPNSIMFTSVVTQKPRAKEQN